MSKIDIDKFVVSLFTQSFNKPHDGMNIILLHLALRDQGLCYKDGEIIELSNLEQNGKECKPANFAKSSKDLQELTEFEMAVQSMLYTEITNALNNDPYVLTTDKIKQASKMLLDKARKYYNEKSIDDRLQWGLLD